MNQLEYKGYTATIEYDGDDDCFVGHVIGINDRIVFDGQSTTELRSNFHEVLDTYLKHCEEIGKPPELPRSGRLLLRLPAKLHAYVAQQAEATGDSVNGIIVGAVQDFHDRGRRMITPQDTAKRRSGRRRSKAMASK